MRAANRRHLFFLYRKLGIDSETRKTIQYSITGKESLKEMDDFEADLVIKKLKSELRKANKARSLKRGTWTNRLPHGDNVINLMTAEQKQKIIAMSIQLYGKYHESAMDRFCKRQFKKKFSRLTSDEAITLIEIQKSLFKRKCREDNQ